MATTESPSDFSGDYYPLANEQGGDIVSPVTFREEAGLHNDESERICFEDNLTLPSQEENTTSLLYTRREPAELNGLNFLNVVTYCAHLFVSWGIGVWGLDGVLETRWEISTKYETLVTPAKWAYYLWAPILILEGVFALAQLFPYYRSRPIIQAGTGFFFFYTFLIQTAWTFFFSFQLFIFSFVSVVAALLSLISLLASQQHSLIRNRHSRMEYTLFRFPFFLHTGWMILMTVDHFSILFRRFEADIGLQIAIDIFSLGIMLAVAVACLTRPPETDFVIPLVILWSYVSLHVCDAIARRFQSEARLTNLS